MAKLSISWADLPPDVLFLISQCLDTRIDTLRFRAVCSSWRVSTPPPKKSTTLPNQMQFPIKNARTVNPTMSPFTLFQTKVLRLEVPESSPKKSWLIKVSEPVEERYRLLNPFSSRPVNNLPDDELFPQVLNLLNLRISEVSKTLCLQNDNPDENDPASRRYFKAGMSRDFDSNRKFLVIEHAGLRCVTIGDNLWRPVDEHNGYTVFENYKNQFLAVDREGYLVIVNETSLMINGLLPHAIPSEGEWYFVQSRGYLYMVARDLQVCEGRVCFDLALQRYVMYDNLGEIPVEFRVFKLEDRSLVYEGWEAITDLGDQIFFISRDCSYAVSARDFAGCRGNKIIFVDEIRHLNDHARGINDDGAVIGGLEDGRVRVGVYNLEDGSNEPIMSHPAYLRMFWPPPNWVMSLMTPLNPCSPANLRASSSTG